MHSYKLINPLIIGDYNTEFKADNANLAAEQTWSSISKHMTGNVPKFGFTILDNKTNKLYHYLVKEKINKEKIVNYFIKPIKSKLNDVEETKFYNYITNLKSKFNEQKGGKSKKRYKKYESSSSSDSDSSDSDKLNFYNSRKYPFYYWWYNPIIYDNKLNSIYIPTFTLPFYPYIELNMSSAFFI